MGLFKRKTKSRPVKLYLKAGGSPAQFITLDLREGHNIWVRVDLEESLLAGKPPLFVVDMGTLPGDAHVE